MSKHKYNEEPLESGYEKNERKHKINVNRIWLWVGVIILVLILLFWIFDIGTFLGPNQ